MNAQRQALRIGICRLWTTQHSAAGRPAARLLAVSKTQPASAVRRPCAAWGQRAFGENYVQEALAKIAALRGLELEWHLIGHLQSNKCRDAAEHFDWVQSVDRAKLVEPLGRHRPDARPTAERADPGQHRRRSQQVRLRARGNRRAGRRHRAGARGCACAD